jgi:hypothetical protein
LPANREIYRVFQLNSAINSTIYPSLPRKYFILVKTINSGTGKNRELLANIYYASGGFVAS